MKKHTKTPSPTPAAPVLPAPSVADAPAKPLPALIEASVRRSLDQVERFNDMLEPAIAQLGAGVLDLTQQKSWNIVQVITGISVKIQRAHVGMLKSARDAHKLAVEVAKNASREKRREALIRWVLQLGPIEQDEFLTELRRHIDEQRAGTSDRVSEP